LGPRIGIGNTLFPIPIPPRSRCSRSGTLALAAVALAASDEAGLCVGGFRAGACHVACRHSTSHADMAADALNKLFADESPARRDAGGRCGEPIKL
jgi:hypothetical protein